MKKKSTQIEEGRTTKALRNMKFIFVFRIAVLFLNFLARTIFIQKLNIEYLGLDRLFGNVLTLLSFAELGIGNALAYHLYKPLAEKDHDSLCSLMHFYKTVYRIIILIILLCGLCLMPFLNYFVAATEVSQNLQFLYILFLLSTVVSYFFAYDRGLLLADQRGYIVTTVQQMFSIFKVILQIIVLVFFSNYILYLIIPITMNLLSNIVCSRMAIKIFPFIRDADNHPIRKKDKKNFWKEFIGLVSQKIGSVVLTGTDSIFISKFLGLSLLGIVSNYLLVINTINSLLNKLIFAITSSIGNLRVTNEENIAKRKSIFDQIFFINVWLYGFISVGLLLMLSPLITDVWLTQKFELNFWVLLVLVLQFYINGIHYPIFTFRTASGYFERFKRIPLIAAFFNIFFDLLLLKFFGLAGIYMATIISRFCITEVADIYLVFKEEFKMSMKSYYLPYLVFFITNIVLYLVIQFVLKYIVLFGILGFVVKVLVIIVLYNAIFLVIFWRTKTLRELRKRIYKIIH